MAFFHSVESILTIVVMFMTGYFIARAGWADMNFARIVSKIVLNIALPCYMLYNLTSAFSRSMFESLSKGLLVPFGSMAVCYLLSVVVSNLFGVNPSRKGVFRCAFFTSNTIFIGLPVNLELFGASSVPYALLYYIANTTFLWTVGAYEISRDGPGGRTRPFFSMQTLRRILSPALLGFIAGLLLVMLGLKLPSFIMSSCRYMGQLTTPLSMFFTGIVLFEAKWKRLKPDKDMLLLIAARFIVSPAVVIVFAHFIRLPELMFRVFVVQAAMPVPSNTGVIAEEYGADYEFGTLATLTTTLLSMAAVPVLMLFIG